MLLLRYCRTEGSCDYTTVVMYRTRSDVESTAETLRGGKAVSYCTLCSGDLHEDASLPRVHSVALIMPDT